MKSILIKAFNGDRYLKNNIFNPEVCPSTSIYEAIKEKLQAEEYTLDTIDQKKIQDAEKVVFFDIPYLWDKKAWKWVKENSEKNVLFCFEPPVVNPFNYIKKFHKHFKVIYTWNDDLVDDKKYFKFHWPQISEDLQKKQKSFQDKKLLTLINGNKISPLPFRLLSKFGKELYNERLTSINFFEKSTPEDFDLYGRGWNKPKKLSIKEKLFGFKKYSSYKGEVDDKIEVLSRYKFSLCFENLTEVNGYITEKIFDCFKARVVPIYWGAENIDEYVPKNCYIDYREINDYKKLQGILENISETEYAEYIKNIEEYLRGGKFEKFLEKHFAETFHQAISH